MNAFSYTDIFETKGIEYLAIISFFLMLVPFWIFLNRNKNVKRNLKLVSERIKKFGEKIPAGLYHSKNHSWAFLEKSGVAYVGLDRFLTFATGKFSLIQKKGSGENIKKGELMAQLVQDDRKLDIYSPISGKVKGYNSDLLNSSEPLLSDPYGHGWLYKIEPNEWKSETNSYLIGKEASDWSDSEMTRLKDFIVKSAFSKQGPNIEIVMQDGGELMNFPLDQLSDSDWINFQKEFIDRA